MPATTSQLNKLNKLAVILLVDDDPGDQELTRRALDNGVLRVELRIVSDGEEALDYLYRRGPYAAAGAAPRPDLILLDLNMPKLNGREVLQTLKKSPDLCRIPVVIMTTSQQEADILATYSLGCNSYIQKPVELERFIEVVRKMGNYWFEVVTLPQSAALSA